MIVSFVFFNIMPIRLTMLNVAGMENSLGTLNFSGKENNSIITGNHSIVSKQKVLLLYTLRLQYPGF